MKSMISYPVGVRILEDNGYLIQQSVELDLAEMTKGSTHVTTSHSGT